VVAGDVVFVFFCFCFLCFLGVFVLVCCGVFFCVFLLFFRVFVFCLVVFG
jgi:hypothetical protein